MELDQDICYRAVKGRDRRFDGVFYTAVRTTGIYCRPSCPAITPQRRNVSFFSTAAGAQGAGYRACRRCLPDATPGSPGVGRRRRRRRPCHAAGRRRGRRARGRRRARPGSGLLDAPAQPRGHPAVRRRPARPRPVAAGADRARADRDHRPVLRRRGLRGRLRQHPAVQRHACARSTPPARPSSGPAPPSDAGARRGTIRTRIAVREPFAADDLHHFLAVHAVRGHRGGRPGLVRARRPAPARSRRRPRRARRPDAGLRRPAPSRWPTPATSRPPPSAPAGCSTPTATRSPSTRRWPRTRCSRRSSTRSRGCACPGTLDGAEMAVQTVLGQQVSVAAARTAAARLVETHGEPLALEGAHTVDPALPDDGDAGRPRPGVVADAPVAGPRARRPRRGARQRRRAPRPQHRPRRDPGRAAGAARHRSVDGRLRRHASARRPRRVPAHRPRRAPRGRRGSASTT